MILSRGPPQQVQYQAAVSGHQAMTPTMNMNTNMNPNTSAGADVGTQMMMNEVRRRDDDRYAPAPRRTPPATATNVIPNEFFSPLSYSLSVDSSKHFIEPPSVPRPPPPTQQLHEEPNVQQPLNHHTAPHTSTTKSMAENLSPVFDYHHHPQPHTQPVTHRKIKQPQSQAHDAPTPADANSRGSAWSADWKRLIMLSPDGKPVVQMPQVAEKQPAASVSARRTSTAAQGTAGTALQQNKPVLESQDVHELLSYIDGLGFASPRLHQELRRLASTDANEDEEVTNGVGVGVGAGSMTVDASQLSNRNALMTPSRGRRHINSKIRVPPMTSVKFPRELHQSPSRSALSDRTNAISNVAGASSLNQSQGMHHKQPYKQASSQEQAYPQAVKMGAQHSAVKVQGNLAAFESSTAHRPDPPIVDMSTEYQGSVGVSRSNHDAVADESGGNVADRSSSLLGTSYISMASRTMSSQPTVPTPQQQHQQKDVHTHETALQANYPTWESPQHFADMSRDRYEPMAPPNTNRTNRTNRSQKTQKSTSYAASPSPAQLLPPTSTPAAASFAAQIEQSQGTPAPNGTPVHGKDSRIVKQLLEKAVATLNDAQRERDSAREWAESVKTSVGQWAAEQRNLLDFEKHQQQQQKEQKKHQEDSELHRKDQLDREALSQQHLQQQTHLIQSLEGAVLELQKQVTHEHQKRQSTEASLQDLLVNQQSKMQQLGNQLSSVEQLVVSATSTSGRTLGSSLKSDSPQDRFSNQRYGNVASDEIPRHVAQTPANQPIRHADDPTTTVMAHKRAANHFIDAPHQSQGGRLFQAAGAVVADGPQLTHQQTATNGPEQATERRRRRTKEVTDRGYMIRYSNGVQKEVHHDGTTVTRFVNGDVETKLPHSGSVAYFHAGDQVLQITLPDQSVLYEYSNQQMERHLPNGDKVIMFPNGMKQVLRCGAV